MLKIVIPIRFVLAVAVVASCGCDEPDWEPLSTGAAVARSEEAGDELAYLIEVSERLAPDKIQVDRELEAWMDGLSEADLAELAHVYERADAAGHMDAISRELKADPPADKRRRRRLLRLMSLFDHLGDRGIEPFDSGRVGYRAVPEEPVDWSAVPDDLRWIIAPAEKYGSLRFEGRILDYIDQMDEAERAEARRLRARYSANIDRLQAIQTTEKMKPGTPEDYIYNLSVFFAYLHLNESDDLPGLRDWERWAKEWEQISDRPGATGGKAE